MESLFKLDWTTLFVPTVPVTEIILRGTVIYLLLFTLLRLLRREAGALSIGDLLAVVLIANAAQNALAGEYKSITEGAILIFTIVGWDHFLNWLGYRSRWMRDVLRPPPLPLIKNGRLLAKNLRQELITMDELMSELRRHGVETVEQVRRCYLEGDGHFSVITERRQENGNNDKSAVL